jgi:hypothetical protein
MPCGHEVEERTVDRMPCRNPKVDSGQTGRGGEEARKDAGLRLRPCHVVEKCRLTHITQMEVNVGVEAK